MNEFLGEINKREFLRKFNIEKSIEGTEAFEMNQDIMKGIDQEEILEKARTGYYKDNAYNRKHGLVGKKYKKDSKEETMDRKQQYQQYQEGKKIDRVEKEGKYVKVYLKNGENTSWEANSDKGKELLEKYGKKKESNKEDDYQEAVKDLKSQIFRLKNSKDSHKLTIQNEISKLKNELRDLEKKKEDLSQPSSHKPGDTTEHNGKKFKKQANGKWLEVSESHGWSKRDHEDEAKNKRVIAWNTKDDEYRKKFSDQSKLNEEAASKLSDKEHSDEEVGIGKQPSEKKEESGEYSKELTNKLNSLTPSQKFYVAQRATGERIYSGDSNFRKDSDNGTDRLLTYLKRNNISEEEVSNNLNKWKKF